jgi:hypothetical protein
MLANMLATELRSSSVYQAIGASMELRISRWAFTSRPPLSSTTHSAGAVCPNEREHCVDQRVHDHHKIG